MWRGVAMRHGYRGVIVSWAAWDGERDAMSEEKMSVERGFYQRVRLQSIGGSLRLPLLQNGA